MKTDSQRKTLIRGARIYHQRALQDLQILFDETQILELAPSIDEDKADQIIDADDLVLLPGLVDTHVHLREPGYEAKETIATGSRAAAAGGFTTIFAMPNLKPFPSTVESMKPYLEKIESDAVVRVIPFATITLNEAGKQLSDFKALKDELGIRYFSDDGVGVADDELMREAIRQAAKEDVLLSCHTEDMRYRKPGASVHEGVQALAHGWIGIPSACEAVPFARDLQYATEIPAKYHGDHISAKESVEALRKAKAAGANVSAEVTAHHLLLEEGDVTGPMFKMNPPLRSHEDRMALIEALEDGTLDFIANDHAPHTMEEKSRPMDKAPFGIVSLETAFPLLYTEFVEKQKRWSLAQLMDWMAEKPADRFGLEATGRIEEGCRPDFFLADLRADYAIDPKRFASKGKNTPFAGWKACAKVVETYAMGRPVYTDPEDGCIRRQTKEENQKSDQKQKQTGKEH